MLKKFLEKFGYHMDKGSIFLTIHGLIYDSQNVAEFEGGCIAMIESYVLHDNTWFQAFMLIEDVGSLTF